jgi:gamma-D-glutamyl-L-lysine dipeptidyl-peptidase
VPSVREVTPLRAEPRHDAEQVTQALPGEPLRVVQSENGWACVRTAYDYAGWVPADVLDDDEPGEDWLEERPDDPVEQARAFVGTRYEWGGLTERGIDCSGLVHMAYRRTGRLVPRDADQQEDAGAEVPEDRLAPGDLVSYGGDEATHIAFWLGDRRILHATDREGADGVIEEREPGELRGRRRKLFRL